MDINDDVLRMIACSRLAAALRMALVCKAWRRVIEDAQLTVLDARKRLVDLGSTALQKELEEALALTPYTLKMHSYMFKRVGPYQCCHVFTHQEAVKIFHQHGGASKLQKRIERRTKWQLAARRA